MNLYFEITSKRIKDNAFYFLFPEPGVKKDVSPELCLKYLAKEYDYSKYIDASLHNKSASLKRGNVIITLMQGKNVFAWIGESERVLRFSLRSEFDQAKIDFIDFYYGNPSSKGEIRGVIRTNSEFIPLKTY